MKARPDLDLYQGQGLRSSGEARRVRGGGHSPLPVDDPLGIELDTEKLKQYVD
ncbi:hypothetical protein ACFY3E_33300 [Streptomyces griseorubiginosus]|uniref:hypothetical protein n=1 Tax=Streptomyces griseorubiginosus TaxID=67304 RepID=UPI0036AF578B